MPGSEELKQRRAARREARRSGYEPLLIPQHARAGLVVRKTTRMIGIDDQVVTADCGAAFGTRPEQSPEAHRYVLWRMWSRDERPLVVIGLNPSTANEIDGDRTVNKCLHFARVARAGGLVMLNLFSYRTPYPADIKKLVDESWKNPDWPDAVTGGQLHDRILRWHTRPEFAMKVVYAWGTSGNAWDLGRANTVMAMLARVRPDRWCFEVNQDGSPKHPLYLRNDTKIQPLETAVYRPSRQRLPA